MIGLKHLSEKNDSDLSLNIVRKDTTYFIGKKCNIKLKSISFQLSTSPTDASKIIHLLRLKQISCALQKVCISHSFPPRMKEIENVLQ